MPQAAVRQYEEDGALPEAEVEQQAVSEAESEETLASADTPSAEDKQDESYYHYTLDTKDPDPWLTKHRSKIIAVVVFAAVALAVSIFYKNYLLSEQTKAIVAAPQLNDIYYIDFRVIEDNLRPAEKFRMAKVKDITGDVVTLNFSSFFYPQEHELNETIRYALLRSESFFQEKRHNYNAAELQGMITSGAILLARRPENNILDGNVVVPDSHFESTSVFIPGKKENFIGLEYLKFAESGSESALAIALVKVQESADLGFAQGQVNLAQMYLTGTAVRKSLPAALVWFKKASLQAYKPAIFKYAIVCQQVKSCAIADFYQELVKAGVNIDFTKQVDIRATTKAYAKALEYARGKKAY
ncbi:hypothetical protein CMT41_09905 [Colwellia sp. MT41]|uniref:sel1 repeat family protein n=1 Tax=Colwellia sp. MT41 TaxID=58049 RepID=UPI0007177598|nr:sel1 repeat family protein [Colwellia sp. MT41]ALO34996.1 hypothetical protein CMT41_09905 [Colwellia sp. MT41]